MSKPYSSSLSDKEWEILEPLIPQKKRTRPPHWTKRQIIDGILYQLKNGCNWRDMPRDLPPFSTVYRYYKEWKDDGTFIVIMKALHSMVREQSEKNPQWTTLIIIDSQAVKNTCNASIESKGFCSYKATNGIKRHLAVDTLGFPFFTHLTKANISDDLGLIEMLTLNIEYFKLKPDDIPKITILLDSGYHIEKLIQGLQEIYPEIMTKIIFEIAPKISKQEKAERGLSGFVIVPTRWVIERTNGWVERCKILVKNFERTLFNATAKLNLCFIRLMLRRIATCEI
jgi:transposase